MLTDQHPITPPPELVERWIKEPGGLNAVHVAAQAARWGADRQLNADCEWLYRRCLISGAEELRAVMRPRPLSLVEQAMAELDQIPTHDNEGRTVGGDVSIIRAALERLQELESNG